MKNIYVFFGLDSDLFRVGLDGEIRNIVVCRQKGFEHIFLLRSDNANVILEVVKYPIRDICMSLRLDQDGIQFFLNIFFVITPVDLVSALSNH